MKFQINISIQVFRVELEAQLKFSSVEATKCTYSDKTIQW